MHLTIQELALAAEGLHLAILRHNPTSPEGRAQEAAMAALMHRIDEHLHKTFPRASRLELAFAETARLHTSKQERNR